MGYKNMDLPRVKYKEIYWAWKSMKQRCLNPKCQAYKNYGARGIGVCEEWMRFEPFLEWALANGWEKGKDIDRRDNDGDYTPENCRYVTREENTNNRRMTIFITVDGVTKPLCVWARELGIKIATIGTWKNIHGKEYVENRIRDALLNGYTPIDNHQTRRRIPIRHVETGMEFRSINEACRHFGIDKGTISNNLKGITKRTKVGIFEFI